MKMHAISQNMQTNELQQSYIKAQLCDCLKCCMQANILVCNLICLLYQCCGDHASFKLPCACVHVI